MINLEDIQDMLPSLYGTGWEYAIGGTQIYEIDGAGTKWAPKKGTRKLNSDAFIVIRRKRAVESSQPITEFNPAHPYEQES